MSPTADSFSQPRRRVVNKSVSKPYGGKSVSQRHAAPSPVRRAPTGALSTFQGTNSAASRKWYLASKRGLDCLFAVLLLVICSPLFVFMGLLVAMDGGPVFYAHRRVGRGGGLFQCYKFRTMFVGANECLEEFLELHPAAVVAWRRDQKLDRDPRITAVGKLLRETSLDELPQLINVIRGDMSLVGPRPVTESELARYAINADSYLSIRPGITGLWQVSGRNRLTYTERVKLDMEYLAKQSLWLDFFILLKTVVVVINGDGK